MGSVCSKFYSKRRKNNGNGKDNKGYEHEHVDMETETSAGGERLVNVVRPVKKLEPVDNISSQYMPVDNISPIIDLNEESKEQIPNNRGDTEDEIAPQNEPKTNSSAGAEASNNASAKKTTDPKDIVVGVIPDKPRPHHPEKSIYKVMYDFQARTEYELDVEKGDRVILLENFEDGWFRVKHNSCGKEGLVPEIYVTPDIDSLETKYWWHDLSRREAEKQLLMPGNHAGSFLVRPSKSKGIYALSVLFQKRDAPPKPTYHYQIKFNEDRTQCFIQDERRFSNIEELVDFYTENDVLCCMLGNICVRYVQPIPFKELEVERNTVEVLKEIGKGHFSSVKQGKFRNCLKVAIKVLNNTDSDAFLREAENMHKLRHPKLVTLLGVCSKESPMFIIMEYMEHGSLKKYLKDQGPEKLKQNDLLDMMLQITEGMAYLEQKEFIHRDVRADNMLVGAGNTVKVGDFGLARVIEDEEYHACGSKFPVMWTALEALQTHVFTTKTDVWSFGVVMYEIITYGLDPFPGIKQSKILPHLRAGNRMTVPEETACPEELKRLMSQCWKENADDRPTFQDLQVAIDNLINRKALSLEDSTDDGYQGFT